MNLRKNNAHINEQEKHEKRAHKNASTPHKKGGFLESNKTKYYDGHYQGKTTSTTQRIREALDTSYPTNYSGYNKVTAVSSPVDDSGYDSDNSSTSDSSSELNIASPATQQRRRAELEPLANAIHNAFSGEQSVPPYSIPTNFNDLYRKFLVGPGAAGGSCQDSSSESSESISPLNDVSGINDLSSDNAASEETQYSDDFEQDSPASDRSFTFGR